MRRGYCAEFPVDLAFYDAGIDCKNAGGPVFFLGFAEELWQLWNMVHKLDDL